MDNWESLIINTFAQTIGVQANKTSFNDFFDSHSIEIFKKFHIKNPTKEEYDLVKELFLNVSDEPLSLKNIVLEMSDTIAQDEIEEVIFCCICPVITGAIKKHRELKPYLVKYGLVTLSIEVNASDLVEAKGDYFITPNMKIFKRNWNGKIVEMKSNATNMDEAIDWCHNDSRKIMLTCGFGVGIIMAVGGYFWMTN